MMPPINEQELPKNIEWSFWNIFNPSAWGDTIMSALDFPSKIMEFLMSLLTTKMRDGMINLIFEPLSKKLFYTSTGIFDSQGFQNLYGLFVRLAISLLIIIFIWNALSKIMGREATPLRIIIFKSILGLAYLTLVPSIVKYIIYFNNALCSFVINSVGGKGVFAPILNPTFGFLQMLLFIIIFLYYILRLLFYYFGRDYLISFLILVAPFVWFMWVEDGLKHNAEMWLKHLIITIFTQFVHSIQLAVFSVIIISLGGTSQTFWSNVESVIFSIVAMSYMIKTPEFVRNFTNEAVGGNMKGALGEIGKFISLTRKIKNFGLKFKKR